MPLKMNTAFWPSSPNQSPQSQIMNQPRNLGMTSAISMATPKPIDLIKTKELEEALIPHGVTETDEEHDHRYAFYILMKVSFLNDPISFSQNGSTKKSK